MSMLSEVIMGRGVAATCAFLTTLGLVAEPGWATQGEGTITCLLYTSASPRD